MQRYVGLHSRFPRPQTRILLVVQPCADVCIDAQLAVCLHPYRICLLLSESSQSIILTSRMLQPSTSSPNYPRCCRCQPSSLQVLDFLFVPLSPIALSSIAQLAGLTSLSSRIKFNPDTQQISPGFPSLRSLEVVLKMTKHFPPLLALIRSTQLVETVINVHATPNVGSLRKAFQALVEHPSQAELYAVTVNQVSEPESISSSNCITSSILKPLLRLKNLQVVSISVSCVYTIDDSFIRDLASSWPHLSKLCLLPSDPIGYHHNHPKVTASGLIPLVIHCPELCELYISFDATKINIPECERLSRGRHISLLSLGVGYSPIAKRAQVAAFLSGLFGGAELEMWNLGDEVFELWAEVEQLIFDFAAVREQERRYEGLRKVKSLKFSKRR